MKLKRIKSKVSNFKFKYRHAQLDNLYNKVIMSGCLDFI